MCLNVLLKCHVFKCSLKNVLDLSPLCVFVGHQFDSKMHWIPRISPSCWLPLKEALEPSPITSHSPNSQQPLKLHWLPELHWWVHLSSIFPLFSTPLVHNHPANWWFVNWRNRPCLKSCPTCTTRESIAARKPPLIMEASKGGWAKEVCNKEVVYNKVECNKLCNNRVVRYSKTARGRSGQI